MRRTACFLFVLAGFGPCVVAQTDTRQSGAVVGEVDTGGVSPDTLAVVLSIAGQPDRVVHLRGAGDFEFRDVPYGQYELKVTTLHGDLIHREYLFLSSAQRVSVRLPRQRVDPTSSGTSATVSAARLQHTPPAKARREFTRAVEASRKNDSVAAVGHLTKAIELDPDFMEAHYNLGVQYLKTQRFELAHSQFQKATMLDPGAPAPLINLASTLISLDRPAEAEVSARKAVRLEGANGIARYLLGLALINQQKNTPEALDNLRRASETVPQAQLIIAEIVKSRGQMSSPEASAGRAR